MSRRTHQSGFSIVEIGIVLVVVALICFIGYGFYIRQTSNTDSAGSAATQPATAQSIPVAPDVESTSDLDAAAATLDETDTSGADDSAALDSQLQSF